ncbi:MAG: hypothetical protein O7A67_02870 [SAR324 cluster bacterium]|nr:hypothetical protein [SAR324 cluster bacterium]
MTAPTDPAAAVPALDVGTSPVRCLAYDGAAQAVPGAAAAREHQVRCAPGQERYLRLWERYRWRATN